MDIAVAVFGSLTQDVYLYVRGGFSLGSSRVAVEYRVGGGGSAANTAVALSRLGVPVGFVGVVGGDDIGHILIEDLAREGVDVRAVQIIEGRASSKAYIIVDLDSGERGMIGVRDAANYFTLGENVIEYVKRASYLHVTGYMLQEGPGLSRAVKLIKRASEKGVIVSLDLTQEISNREILRGIYGDIRYLLGNEGEFLLLGYKTTKEDLRRAQREIGCDGVIVKLGERGSVAFVEGEFHRSSSFQVPIIDTTGAGDAFNAGFLYGLVKGYDVETCLEIANAIGAYACRGKGARYLPRREDLREMLGYEI